MRAPQHQFGYNDEDAVDDDEDGQQNDGEKDYRGIQLVASNSLIDTRQSTCSHRRASPTRATEECQSSQVESNEEHADGSTPPQAASKLDLVMLKEESSNPSSQSSPNNLPATRARPQIKKLKQEESSPLETEKIVVAERKVSNPDTDEDSSDAVGVSTPIKRKISRKSTATESPKCKGSSAKNETELTAIASPDDSCIRNIATPTPDDIMATALTTTINVTTRGIPNDPSGREDVDRQDSDSDGENLPSLTQYDSDGEVSSYSNDQDDAVQHHNQHRPPTLIANDLVKLTEAQLEHVRHLVKAIVDGNFNEFMELLEKRGFKSNLLNVFIDGQTALHYSLIYGRSLSWCKQLVLNGANPNLTNRSGWHPIHLAAYSCSLETMRFLIDCITD